MAKNDYNLHIHLTEQEYQEMQKQRDFLGYKTNAQLIRSFIHTNVCYSIDYDGLFELATQLSRIGTNINQIAKVANETQSVTAEQVNLLREHIKEIDNMLGDTVKEQVRVRKRISKEFWLED